MSVGSSAPVPHASGTHGPPAASLAAGATAAKSAPKPLVADSARMVSTGRRSRVAEAAYALGGTGLQQHQRVHDAAELDDVADSEDKFSHYNTGRLAGNNYGSRERKRDGRRRLALARARRRRNPARPAAQSDLIDAVVDIAAAIPARVARSRAGARAVVEAVVDPGVALMLRSLVRTAAVVRATRQIAGPIPPARVVDARIRLR